MDPDPLNQHVNAGILQTLHEHRLLSADAYAAARARLRQGIAWRRWVGNLLLVVGVALVLAGIVVYIVANWHALGRYARFAGLETLLFGCAIGAWYAGLEKPLGRLLLLAAAALVGAVLLLTGITYNTNAEAYEFVAAWAALVTGFALVSRFSGMWLFWLTLLNVAFLAWWCAQPDRFLSFKLNDVDQICGACMGVALLNALALAAREIAVGRERPGMAWLAGRESRILPLLAVLIALFIPAAILIVEWPRGPSGDLLIPAAVLQLVVLAAAFIVYRRAAPDLVTLALCGLSVCGLLLFGVARALFDLVKGIEEAYKFLGFGVATLLVFGVAVLWLKHVHTVMTRKDEDE